MKILVTGAKGFIGKNLIVELKNHGYKDIFEYDMDSTLEELETYAKECEFVFHLAGVNRPKEEKEFVEGNYGFTSTLLEQLKKFKNKSTIVLSSSIQAALENPYGISKKMGEELLFNYGKDTGAKVLVYRFANVFGKWCRPNYNSAVATFSYNIARDLPITVNNRDVELNLIYIDDLVSELIRSLKGEENRKDDYCYVEPVHKVTLGKIVDLLYSFKESRMNRQIPNTEDPFIKKLYSNYLSYLPTDQFSYDLKMNIDHRGSFTEFIKSPDRGQVSINISKPGIIKGNHWHHTKNEKFLVVSGKGVIRFRKVDETEVIEYFVSGEKLQVVDIPPGYTHNIENLGDTDMVTVMWANEKFDPEKPDTYFVEV
ncbi:capsular polysaccharide biosynthesis protein CapF [Acholeplasma equirhinis]|uniref:capsular polysaccharide biosynthesis protein CapF n=1 Tax=Acholeplasma equirhinis TaxID=555393 RepID=UPI00197A971B|nr:capsular polysaccharide biosynthesis protein CapF [Acholeplasma equirhinis]MBN3489977.1 capsular polysaccharide biosynthesis protein CapF [Acholeplasma equirhinis]